MILRFRVTPNAVATQLTHWDGTYASLRLKASPTENKANEALLLFCKTFFQLPKSSIVLVKGHKSRIKHIQLPLAETDVHQQLMQAVNRLPPQPKDGIDLPA